MPGAEPGRGGITSLQPSAASRRQQHRFYGVLYLTQLGFPALAGSLAGTALGSQRVLPRIQENPVFNVTVAVPAWIGFAVPATMLALTGLAALVPAVRAGRLPAVPAITAGQAPAGGHGHGARRLAGKLPLPRPVTAGLAGPFTRPARPAAALATITVGLTAAVLAAGLGSQITKIVKSTGAAEIDRVLSGRPAWLVVVLAGAGVFATLLTQARERVRELGIRKALGMTPRQVITMVTGWAAAPAVIAAAIAVPACTVLEPVAARAVVSAQAGPAENMTPFMPHVPGGPGAAPAPGELRTQGVPGRAAPSGQAAPSSGALPDASPSPRQSRIAQQSGSGQQPGQSVRALFAGPFRTAGDSRLCGPFPSCHVVYHDVSLRVDALRCPRTYSGRRPCRLRGRCNRRLSTDGHGQGPRGAHSGFAAALSRALALSSGPRRRRRTAA